MPSSFSHPAPAVALATLFRGGDLPRSAIVTGMICSTLPDLDVLGFYVGVSRSSMLSHRGLTHSVPFAAALALVAAFLLHGATKDRMHLGKLWLYLFLATASHGLFDALTNGGRGVAFFAPFWPARYFFPFRPIEVSPIGITRFFSQRGRRVLVSECRWVWLPSLVFLVVAHLLRSLHDRPDRRRAR
jgi:inner membrane protein